MSLPDFASRALRARGDIAFALGLTLAVRIFYSVAAAALVPGISVDSDLRRSNQLIEELAPPSTGAAALLVRPWERFDTLWYLHIANFGYDRPDAVVFYPLYPGLIRVLAPVAGSALIAALLISTGATFFLFLGLLKLARLDGTAERAYRAAFLCAVWPAGFIFLAGYPEALVAALTVWALYAARSSRWGWAGAAGFAAGLAKAVGVLSVVPLAVLALPALRRRERAASLALLPLFAPVAVAGWVRFSGQGSSALAYGAYWRTQIAFPWTTLAAAVRRAVEGPDALVAMNLGALLLVVLLVLALPTRREHTLYALAAVAFFLVKRTDPLLQSTLRYAICVFPAYLSLARALETWWLSVAVALPFLVLNLILLWHFVHWSLLL